MKEKEISTLGETLNELKKYINNRLIVESDSPPVSLKRKKLSHGKTSEKRIKKIEKSLKDSFQDLGQLRELVHKCRKCELHKTKTNYVFGEGDPSARLMFIGEAPGYSEDIQGKPFVGRAGQLLDKILNAMGLDRNSVYIANVLKCRPPNNRNPLPEEIEACTDYVRIQIELIKPSVICSLGLFAGQFLLDNPMLKMGEMRGKEFDYNGIPVIPTYHPAYLLRNPSQKKVVWDDMIKIMKLLGIKNKYTAGAKDSEDQI